MVKRVWRYISGLPGLHIKPREKSKVHVLIPDPSSLRPLSLGNKVNIGAVSALRQGGYVLGAFQSPVQKFLTRLDLCVVCPAFVSFLHQRAGWTVLHRAHMKQRLVLNKVISRETISGENGRNCTPIVHGYLGVSTRDDHSDTQTNRKSLLAYQCAGRLGFIALSLFQGELLRTKPYLG